MAAAVVVAVVEVGGLAEVVEGVDVVEEEEAEEGEVRFSMKNVKKSCISGELPN